MKDLISTKTISVVTATLTAAMLMLSVALITPAAAQDRLAENPDIHKPADWLKFHAGKLGKPSSGTCDYRCIEEFSVCLAIWEQRRNADSSDDVSISIHRDCKVLNNQCKAQECTRYR